MEFDLKCSVYILVFSYQLEKSVSFIFTFTSYSGDCNLRLLSLNDLGAIYDSHIYITGKTLYPTFTRETNDNPLNYQYIFLLEFIFKILHLLLDKEVSFDFLFSHFGCLTQI